VEEKRKTESNIRKLKEFDKYIKEAPKYSFNTNIFKNVKLAMSEQEKEHEETLIRELATFLKEKAIDKLIVDL
jgi:hypothetical protein